MAKLIVLEGLDGSGKGTQTKILRDTLRSEGKKVRLIDFPMYDRDSSHFVKLYLSGGLGDDPADTNAYAASMFFATDRYVSYRTDWRADYLAPDTVVIANRYTTSNAVHQASKLPEEEREGFLTWLFELEYERLGLPKPDLVLYLDMPFAISQKMMRRREADTGTQADIHEQDAAYLLRCRENARAVADSCGWTVLNCARGDEPRSLQEIHEEIFRRVQPLL